MIQMNTDAAWLRAKAEAEANGIVSVGGLVPAKDTRFRKATVRFAARSEPVAGLLPEEPETGSGGAGHGHDVRVDGRAT